GGLHDGGEDDAAILGRLLRLGDGGGGEGADPLAPLLEGVTGDVEAEGFLLLAQGFLLVPGVDAGEGGLGGWGDVAAAEEAALADALAEVGEGGEGAGGATERRSDGGAGAGARRRRLGDGGVRFSAFALLDDRGDGGGAGAFDRPQPESHVPVLGVAGFAI